MLISLEDIGQLTLSCKVRVSHHRLMAPGEREVDTPENMSMTAQSPSVQMASAPASTSRVLKPAQPKAKAYNMVPCPECGDSIGVSLQSDYHMKQHMGSERCRRSRMRRDNKKELGDAKQLVGTLFRGEGSVSTNAQRPRSDSTNEGLIGARSHLLAMVPH